MRLVQTVGYLAQSETYPTSIVTKMKTNSDASKTLYLGLDLHKAETFTAILKSDSNAEPRHYGSIAPPQHALERAIQLFLRLNHPHFPAIRPLQTQRLRTFRLKFCLA